MRYLFEVSYEGTNYHGWQYQENAVAIQNVIENSLSIVLNKKVGIIGAGRTDTGVHAHQMYFHIDYDYFQDLELLLYNLNNCLPKDISIKSIIPVKKNTHARYSAVIREYEYLITNKKNAFLNNKAYLLRETLNIDLMNVAAKYLIEVKDFSSFCKRGSDVKSHICTVKRSEWVKKDNLFIYNISADRFLRNMVRAIVGTLIKVGSNKISIKKFKAIIEDKDRESASCSAPAHGLYLKRVIYPKEILDEKKGR